MRVALEVAQFAAAFGGYEPQGGAVGAFLWLAMARDSRWPSGRRVVIIATLISNFRNCSQCDLPSDASVTRLRCLRRGRH